MICQNCNNTTFYTLANDYIKCKTCAKKYSLKKLQKDDLIIIQFCENKNALEVSKELEVNYKTIKDRFDVFRKKIALFLENEYNNSINSSQELQIAIKGDAIEEYPAIKKVMDILQDQKINSFSLVTGLRGKDF